MVGSIELIIFWAVAPSLIKVLNRMDNNSDTRRKSNSCLRCSTKRFLTTEFCRRHYYEEYGIDLPFSGHKERSFVEIICNHLTSSYNIKGFVTNKQLPGTSIRPDLYFYVLTTLFIVEIDEDQHKRYDSDSEKERIKQLSNLIDNQIVIIRINPDRYSRGPAIWTKELVIKQIGEKEECVIHKDEDEFERRKCIVLTELDHLLTLYFTRCLRGTAHLKGEKNDESAHISIRYLFYDRKPES